MDQTLDLTVFITRDGEELITDSRAVAIAFKRQHRNVRRIIDAMLVSQHAEIREHAAQHFERSSYVDSTGRRQVMYRMTRAGFAELAMGFTGDLSRILRIRFLNAFEEVTQRLQRAEKTITEMLNDHSKRAAVSETKGRIGSQLMHERRREKPALKEEESALLAAAQPALPLH